SRAAQERSSRVPSPTRGAGLKRTNANDSPSVLVVAGEPSGDRMAAGIARALSAMGARCAGMGGEASARAGVRILADLRKSAAMGFTEVAARLPAIVASYATLARFAERERPRAAVLVDHQEFSRVLGRRLRRLG